LQAADYEREAQAYLRSLPLEHFMEAIPQATQRKITLESLDLVHLRRPEVQVYNELLVQYPLRGQRKPGQVVPDNMVVLSDQPARSEGSYNVPLEATRPFWVLEYVSSGNPRKDYEDSFRKYEKDLKVPYYLLFYPDTQDLTLYRHNKRRYVSVKPNRRGRYAVRELDLEVGLLDGWVRFWFRGELLSLPAELQRDLDTVRGQLAETARRAEEAIRQAEEEKRRAEEERVRAQEEKRRAEEAIRQAEEEKRRAEEERVRAQEEKRRANEEKLRADLLQQRLAAAERELAASRSRPQNRH
jgi:Uma2 family endonuclease